MNAGQFDVVELQLDTVRSMVASRAFEVVRSVNLCGNLGDPIYHSRFHEVLEIFKALPVRVSLFTAGAGRQNEWWEHTLSILDRTDRCVFAIDGLATTNHNYRVNSRWDDVFSAMCSCAGRVDVEWRFIRFRHNQDQIQEAREMAKKIGVSFVLVTSDRFDGKYWTGVGPDPLKPDEEIS